MLPKINPFLFSVLPGIAVFALSELLSFLNPILGGLLLGILISNFIRIPNGIQTVSQKAGSRFLEFSVLFLAFGINYSHLAHLGWQSLLFVFLLVLLVLIATFSVSKKPLDWLIGFGTAICGSSAIAALAPSLEKEKGDAGIAMAVVNLYGMLGMIVLPFVLIKLDLQLIQNAFILGGSLHSVGNVAGAGYMISNEAGELAVTVKLARVALLSFGLVFFNFVTKKSKDLHWVNYFRLPWYVWGFIMITLLVSVIEIPNDYLKLIELAGKLLLTIAMTNIGMQIRFRDLIQSGKKGLVFGLGIWIFQLIVIAVFLRFLK